MALVVNVNLQSMNSFNKLNETNQSLGSVFKQISSGFEVNEAADDEAGLGVSGGLRARAVGTRATPADRVTLTHEARTARDLPVDGKSATAEEAMNEVGNILKRMRNLATEAATDTVGAEERSFIQDEFDQLSAEGDAAVTSFNGSQKSEPSESVRENVNAKSREPSRESERQPAPRVLAAYATPPPGPRPREDEPEPNRPRIDTSA